MDLATLSRFHLDRPPGRPSAWAVLLSVVALLVVVAALLASGPAPPDPALVASWRWPHGVFIAT